VLLSRKTSRTLYISQRYKKKTAQCKFSTVELGKGNSEKMCLQPAPEGAECLKNQCRCCQLCVNVLQYLSCWKLWLTLLLSGMTILTTSRTEQRRGSGF